MRVAPLIPRLPATSRRLLPSPCHSCEGLGETKPVATESRLGKANLAQSGACSADCSAPAPRSAPQQGGAGGEETSVATGRGLANAVLSGTPAQASDIHPHRLPLVPCRVFGYDGAGMRRLPLAVAHRTSAGRLAAQPVSWFQLTGSGVQ